jgi:hypothetical protein
MRHFLTISVLFMVPLFFLWGCENDTSNDGITGGGGGGDVTDMTCIGCHSSRDMLEAAIGKVSGSKVLVPNKGDG